MEHYDGPALFRKREEKRVEVKQEPKYQNRPKEVQPTPKQEERPKPATTYPSAGGMGKNFQTRTFHPKYVPPSRNKFKHPASRKRYDVLINELRKTPDSFLLFATEGDQDVPFWSAADQKATSQLVEAKVRPQTVEEPTATLEPKIVEKPGETVTEPITQLTQPTGPQADPVIPDSAKVPVVNSIDSVVVEKIGEVKQTGPVHPAVTVVNMSAETIEEKSNPPVPDQSKPDVVAEESKVESIVEPISKSNTEITGAQMAELPPTEQVVGAEPAEVQEVETEIKAELTAESEPLLADLCEEVKGYQFPPLSLLPAPVIEEDDSLDEWVLEQIDVLNETLAAFHVDASVKDWTIGPTVTQFEITLERGVKVSKITNLTDDLKLALAARDIRIEAPIPGKSSVGIEIPNQKSRPVMLSEVVESKVFKDAKSPLTIALGVDLFGQPRVTDLQKMPHGLIAGATGSGKSVFINSLLVSILYKAKPSEVKLLLIDPKAVEMAPYHDLPHLISPVISDPKAAAAALHWVVEEMERRYQKLAASGARNIGAFNDKAEKHGDYDLKMPYIVVVIDELADLMMVASSEVQDYIARITQKARAAGIHLIVATQRPSVDVITGTIKNNIPTRIAFMVSSQIDSRTILDTAGAERLLGRGDMLFLGNGAGQPFRLQGTYIEEEVEEIADFVRQQGKPRYAFDPDSLRKKEQLVGSQDELMPQVLEYIVGEENISTSKLQRVFSIGYNRAANIVDQLEADGLISGARGSKPREVYLDEQTLHRLLEPKQ